MHTPIRYRSHSLTVAFVLAALAGGATTASAQEEQAGDGISAEAFPVDDENPEASVPTREAANRHPLQMGYFVMLLIERAEEAVKRKDHAAAVKYYRALAKAVPEQSTAYSKLCQAYEAAGRLAEALASCRTALGRPGVTVGDHLRFVDLVLKQKGKLGTTDIADVEAVIEYLETKAEPKTPLVTAHLRCDLATRLEDVPRMEQCTAKLRALAPNDPRTIAFAWALALKKRDHAAAAGVIEHARRSGLPATAVAKMELGLRAQREQSEPWRRWLRVWGVKAVSAATLLTALAVLALVVVRRRRTASVGRLGQSHRAAKSS